MPAIIGSNQLPTLQIAKRLRLAQAQPDQHLQKDKQPAINTSTDNADIYGRGFQSHDTHRGTNRHHISHAQAIRQPDSNGQEAMISNRALGEYVHLGKCTCVYRHCGAMFLECKKMLSRLEGFGLDDPHICPELVNTGSNHGNFLQKLR
ncbi:hypothetical protein Tco_1196065 [Tanacetum coccineum]